MIFYLQGFASDKLYGKALNEHIKHLPDDAWICITDGDTMFLNDNFGSVLEQAIKDNPDAELMTCATNRTWGKRLDNDPNILNHWKRAQNRPVKYTEIKGVVPAHLWLFPKSTWLKTPFDEHPIIYKANSFDARWARGITGKKILIEHLYIFHFYRLQKHFRDYNHLV